MNREQQTVAITGAGPAGLAAAIAAARAGAAVIVFEKLPEAGTRLLATGGGRCNFTNTLETREFIRRFGDKSRFVAPALKAMDASRLRRFFEELGVPSHSPDGFHVFPASNSARSIRDALVQECRKLRVAFRFNSRVKNLRIDQGRVTGISTAGGLVSAARVILTAGGASHPDLGGGQCGYELARSAGHTIAPLCPALVPLVTAEGWPGTLAGITLPQVTIRLTGRNPAPASTDSLLFTHQGISGPAALNASGQIASALLTNPAVAITLDLFHEKSNEAWRKDFGRWREEHGARTILATLGATLPAALARVILDLAGVLPDTRVARLTRDQISRLIEYLTNLPLTVTDTEGFAKAMATRGGVALDEVEPKTLESKLVRGLLFAGEVLDVDGPCGGFNLHWAFASGFLAGQ